jgi:hypothetical protein
MHTRTAFGTVLPVDLLSRGASPYDVAKLLRDTVETIERHYAPFVRELRERARRIMETGEGSEITGTPRAHQGVGKDKNTVKTKDIVADEPVSRNLRALLCFQQVP